MPSQGKVGNNHVHLSGSYGCSPSDCKVVLLGDETKRYVEAGPCKAWALLKQGNLVKFRGGPVG